jgi:hypothetical protein
VHASDRWIAPPDSGGRSLTSCRETTSVLADGLSRTFADVAQQEERDHAMVEATSSKLVIRSTSGVSMHSAAALLWCWRCGMCATQGRSHVQRDTTSDGMLAFGHSRSGNTHALVAQQAEQPPCKRQAARSIRRRGHQTCRVRLAGFRTLGFGFAAASQSNPGTRVRIPHATPDQGALVELALRGWKSAASIGRRRNP